MQSISQKFMHIYKKVAHSITHWVKHVVSHPSFKMWAAGAIVVIAIGVAFGAGAYVGEKNYIPGIEGATTLSNKMDTASSTASTTVDFSPFWKVWNILNKQFVATHPNQKNDDQQKVYGAIQGMVNSLGDPYTVFLPPQQLGDFNADIQGDFEGVGMEIGPKDGNVVVIAPLKGSPAEAAGLLSGDVILKVDSTVIDPTTMSADDVVNMIRGKAGTQVTITVARGKEVTPRVFTVTRQVINIPTVDTATKTVDTPDGPQTVFVISLYTFTADSPDLFRAALQSFVSSNTNKLIIDLRGNPGGYLDAAVDIASWFLPKGAPVVTEDFGSSSPQQAYTSLGYNVFNNNLKLAILVDGGSASAAEILSGALSQNSKATLVGEKTFGKGSVQELIPITDDTSLKVTVARWLTPNGSWISGNGIVPDVVVDRTQDDVNAGRDPQMDAALKVVTGTYTGTTTPATGANAKVN